MVQTFKDGKDIYASIASVAFKVPYEDCLEFHPETHEYQPEGKKRRGVAKVLMLGINYGMSVQSIAESLYAKEKTMSEDQKLQQAQEIYDAVMKGFPHLRDALLAAQRKASTVGYTETFLGRRRHHPNMMLPEFEFTPMAGYVNPNLDPTDPSTFEKGKGIPEEVVAQLTKEFKNYKYYGQIVKRTKELYEQKIKVINNRPKINEASRQVWNAIIQGSAADLTKLAILRLENNEEWKKIGGRLLLPVHDELIVEVPFENRDKGANILKESMESAGSFLPFPISCDIEETFRWYGLAVDDILAYDKPSDTNYIQWSESNICWLQCMLTECEYQLPVFKNADGSSAIGIAAHGVNGRWSPEMDTAIADYISRYDVHIDDFLDNIESRVVRGATK